MAGIVDRGGRALACRADIRTVADVRRLFAETIARFGRVDVS